MLDYALVDPRTGAFTLVGHRDPRFGGPQIPYLQHLASLLEYPEPEFSLAWTRESETSIDALFRRLDSDQEVRRIAREWGRWFDDEGRVTPQGRWALPLFGVTPPTERSLDSLTGQEITAMILRAAGNTRGAD
ncbi:MAG: hypothetical protein ACREN5_09205, partial [Gemmatimonadales bacterium]